MASRAAKDSMPISSAGRTSSSAARTTRLQAGRKGGLQACPLAPQSGVTLVELLIVMAIIGLMAGVSFPAISSGIDSIRLTQASDSLVTFLNGAVNRAERRQQAVALTIRPKEGKLEIYTN